MLLGPSSNAEDSNDNSSDHTNNTKIDDIQKLLENALKNEKFTDILRRVFPQLSDEEAARIEDTTAKVFEENLRTLKTKHDKTTSSEEESYFFHKLSFAITMTIIGTYFGGPITATFSSTLFTRIYTIIFGVPNSDSMLYGMFFAPCKKFLNTISNQYGAYLVGTLAATTSYSTANAIEYLGKRIRQIQRLLKRTNYSNQTAEEIFAEFELMNISDDIVEVERLDEDSFTMILPAYDSVKKLKKTSDKKETGIEPYNSSTPRFNLLA